jgi:hypothetical protein
MRQNTQKPGKPTYDDLSKAIENHDLALVQELLAAGADVNQANGQGITPLMVAVRDLTEFDIIKLLVDYGARISARDRAGRSAIDRIEIPPEPADDHENAHEAWTHSDEAFVMLFLAAKEREELAQAYAREDREALT